MWIRINWHLQIWFSLRPEDPPESTMLGFTWEMVASSILAPNEEL
jgi:hypothetical protein